MPSHLKLVVKNGPSQSDDLFLLPVHEFGSLDKLRVCVDYVIRRYEGKYPARDVVSIEYLGPTKSKLKCRFKVVYREF